MRLLVIFFIVALLLLMLYVVVSLATIIVGQVGVPDYARLAWGTLMFAVFTFALSILISPWVRIRRR